MRDPTLQRNNLILPAITINRLYYWFFLNSIQILMKSINQKWKELLWVMLSITWKHLIYSAYLTLYIVWWKGWVWIAPHWLYKLSIWSCQLTTCSYRIDFIYLTLEITTKKIIRQWNCIWQTLQTAVHKTSVTQIW